MDLAAKTHNMWTERRPREIPDPQGRQEVFVRCSCGLDRSIGVEYPGSGSEHEDHASTTRICHRLAVLEHQLGIKITFNKPETST